MSILATSLPVPFIMAATKSFQSGKKLLSSVKISVLTTWEPLNGRKSLTAILPEVECKWAHILDKKIVIKKLQFGSRIDKDSQVQREEFYIVKGILNPEKISLSNGLIMKLLGVKVKPGIDGQATSFLLQKTKGKKVFLKFDQVKHDIENNLLCYLPLENKTFINAHLIKNGLVNVDENTNYKFKDKFLQLHNQTFKN